MSKERNIIIFDTTLRDGEQAPGASMSLEQKLDVARTLAKMKVDVIEAGFPISSEVQFEACRQIAKEVKGPVICALARAVKGDIDSAYNAIKHAAKPRIHTFIATSDIHIKHKFKKTPAEVMKLGVDAVKYAASLVKDVEFSAEDATRSRIEFLSEIVEAVIDAGATTINIPDTVGYTVPSEFSAIIRELSKRVKNIDKAVLSVHCHNDLGLATANSLAAIEAGATQIECTINGVGERAGSAALEEVVMALAVRKDAFPATTNIVTREIYNASKKVSSYTGFTIQPNKAIVGKNAFAHESGIHQDGMLKSRETYEIMTPESIGRESSSLIMGRHTGRHGFSEKLVQLGFSLEKSAVETMYTRFLQLADKKKEVYDDDIIAIVNDGLNLTAADFTLDYMHVLSGNSVIPSATVRLKKDGTSYEEAASGDGPVDALFNAVDKITGIKSKLGDYEIHAVTGGKDAVGEVSLSIIHDDERFSGRGASTDVLEASLKAYLNAVNKCRNRKKKAS
ncbi:MAG: 2-isopropylmalate synthase [Spirochaetes bacterium]|nr:2-isopropylmalate synthase [Spirochaetota bacterium]